MNEINFTTVCEFIKNSEEVNANSVVINQDQCSITIQGGNIIEAHLLEDLFNETQCKWEVLLEGDNAILQLAVDDEVLEEIMKAEYDVKLYDDNKFIIGDVVTEDEIKNTFNDYGISKERVIVSVRELTFFDGCEIEFGAF